MFPDLPALGPIHLHTYGILLALGFWLGSGLVWREARRQGWDENSVATLSLLLLLVSVIGARGFFVVTHLGDYAHDPLGALRIWEGGLTLYGGILLAIPAGIWYCHYSGLPTWSVADAIAPAVALGTALGRLGCFFNGCCYGTPTRLPWGIRFPAGSAVSAQYPGLHVHPSQLYASAGELLILAVLLPLRRRFRAPGQFWWLFVTLDSVARYIVDLTRYYEPSAYITPGVTISQAISVGLFTLGLFQFVALGRKAGRVHAAH